MGGMGGMGGGGGGGAPRQQQDAVNAEPKLFIGQLLPSVTQADIVARFSMYGAVKNCTLMVNPETGKSKGCAMITYERFSHAEAAMQSEDGTFYLSGDRKLVVKFADPTRKEDGRVVGIAPKKLFVGQVFVGALWRLLLCGWRVLRAWRACVRAGSGVRVRVPRLLACQLGGCVAAWWCGAALPAGRPPLTVCLTHLACPLPVRVMSRVRVQVCGARCAAR